MERWPDLAATAEQNLWALGITNASIVVGDGTQGLAAHAPFDAVVVCAAFPRVRSLSSTSWSSVVASCSPSGLPVRIRSRHS